MHISHTDIRTDSRILKELEAHRKLGNYKVCAIGIDGAGGNPTSRIHSDIDIEAKKLPYIFDAYYSTRPQGSGLGLPTAKKIIQSHNGEIRVDSEVGKGTSFTLKLPLVGTGKKRKSDEQG